MKPPPWRLALLLICALAVPALGAEAPLVVERTIALPGVSGRIDHMAVDVKRQRLFVAEVGSGGLDEIDLMTGQRLKRVEGLKQPQGVAYLPALNQVVVASGGDGTVRFYLADGLEPVGEVRLAGDADNVRLDAKTGLVVAAYGSGIALIDPVRCAIVGDIPLRAHPEGFQIDPAAGRAYLNIPDRRRIVVVDLAARREIGELPTPGLFLNFPMTLLPGGGVATVFRAPATLLTLDPMSGTVATKTPTCGDSDDVHFDTKRGRLYVTCGAGAVEAFQQMGGVFRSLGKAPTRAGARTALFVPELDRLFVAARAGALGGQAAIMVLRPAD